MFTGFLQSEIKQKQNDIQTKTKQLCRMAERAATRLAAQNRPGLRCDPHFTLLVGGIG